jgi:hypothetical protein
MRDTRHRFGRTTFLLAGGLLAWLANFVFIYVFAAVACARGFSALSIVGVRVVPLAAVLGSAIATAVTFAMIRRARSHAMSLDEQERFVGFVTVATSGIALVAMVLLLLPPLLVDGCSGRH